MLKSRQPAKLAPLLLLSILALSGAPAYASSTNFVLSGQGIELGQAEEVVENNGAQPPRYATKIPLGQAFTLVAQGWVYPRGAKGSPAKAEEARWRFDEEDFKKLEHDAKAFDETMTVVKLQPTTIGRTLVRFKGKILGYERQFDMVIDIIAPPK